MERKTISVREAACLLGISRGLAYQAVRRGEIPVLRIGRRFLIHRHHLEKLLDVKLGAPEVSKDRCKGRHKIKPRCDGGRQRGGKDDEV